MKTTLLLVRHGESLGNRDELFLGHTDLGLSELGHRQAAALAAAPIKEDKPRAPKAKKAKKAEDAPAEKAKDDQENDEK